MEGYYNKTKFHRLVKGFILQGGDPTGTGKGGESIYGKPFKVKFIQPQRAQEPESGFNANALIISHERNQKSTKTGKSI